MEACLEKHGTIFNRFEKRIEVKVQQRIFTNLCKKFKLPEPTAEYQFHLKRKWRIDYFFENEVNGLRLALEVEGPAK